MKIFKKIFLIAIAFALVITGIYYSKYYYNIALIGAGYKAKIICSGIFITKKSEKEVLNNDLKIPALSYFDHRVDYSQKSVTVCTLFGLIKRKAVFHPERGAILDWQRPSIIASDREYFIQNSDYNGDENLDTDIIFDRVNYKELHSIVDRQFEIICNDSLRTQAIIILYKGKIIAERYNNSINENTRLCGWSMTKSFGNIVAGILVRKNLIHLDEKINISNWMNDMGKNEITLDNLLRMMSGLEFNESYKKYDSDVLKMLYLEKDAAKYAASKDLIHSPGTHWNYSSGTSNILAKFVHIKLAQNKIHSYQFVKREILNKIGMSSALLESDKTGTMLFSTGLYATAREWACFGKFLYQNGIWNNQMFLPEWWLDYSTTRTKDSRYQKHGAHFWIKPSCAKKLKDWEIIKQLPNDMFYAAGHYGQFIFIVPSKNMVVVRLAQTYNSDNFNEYKFLLNIVNTIKM